MKRQTLRRRDLLIALATATTLTAVPAHAQTYPAKTVKVIVPYSPGSNPDVAARIVAQALQQRLGQPFVIENKVGAGGSIGLAAGAKSAADGYTIVVGHVGALAINPSVYSKLPYDTERDFIPVMQTYKSPLLMLVAESSPYRSVADVVAAAKAKPGELRYSSGGNGNGAHLSGELLASSAGVTMQHIPYKSVADALVAVASGDIAFSFGNQSLGWPLVQGGKLRALAFSGDSRVAEHPNVPVVGETVKGFEFNDWSGIFVPAGTPAAIAAKLQLDISAVLAQPEVVRQMRAQGLIPVQNSSAQFVGFIASEQKKWGQLARQINLKMD